MTSVDLRRVLFYLPEMKVGGAEISLLRLAQGLREHGMQPAFAIHRADAAARRLAGDMELVSLDADRTLAAVRRLAAVLHGRRPDFLVSALTHANVVAAISAKLARVPTRVVLSEHAPITSMRQVDGSRTYRATLAAMPWAYRLADSVVAVSQGVYDDIGPMLAAGTRRRFEIIPNPVLRPDWQAMSQAAVEDEWFDPGAAPVVLSVGRLSPEKNFALLIRAFAQLPAASGPQPRLAIIGDGPERDRLRALIDALGLHERVRLLGQRDNPFAYMRRSRVFAFASNFEGFGNVLIEAMACGLPIVCTDCPVGPREILCDGRYGDLVAPGDVDALAAALQRRLCDPLPAPGAQARALEFTAERSVAQYLALFARLSATPRRRR